MQTQEPFYLYSLKESLSQRQRKNRGYSLRAFAKDLGLDSSNLSSILRKKRGLPPARAQAIARRLKLSPKAEALFVASTIRAHTKLDAIKVGNDEKRYLLDEKYYHVIAEWDYYALLQLMDTTQFKSTVPFISSRLGISKNRAQLIIRNLIDLRFIEMDAANSFRRTVPGLDTSEDVESRAIQLSHVESLQMGVQKIAEVPLELRDFSSVTMAINPDNLPEAKAVIREFQEKIHALLTSGLKSEVYQFNCQLFPLTKKETL